MQGVSVIVNQLNQQKTPRSALDGNVLCTSHLQASLAMAAGRRQNRIHERVLKGVCRG
jgi:hypothetical protein